MTSIGRGRGWGKNPQGNERRPGQQLEPPQVPNAVENDVDDDANNEWIERINKLDITDVEAIKSPQNSIANLINSSPLPEDLQNLEKATKKAIRDRAFALKMVLAFTNSTNITAPFLGSLQPYYENRVELFKKNREHFLNLVFILGEAYCRIRYTISKNVPPKVLEVPLVVCLKMLLEIAGEEEIELVVIQISLNGPMLQSREVKELKDLFIYAREVLITRNISPRSKALLLLLIELYEANFKFMTGHVEKFYIEKLGQQFIFKIQQNIMGRYDSGDNDKTHKNDDIPGIMSAVAGSPWPQSKQPIKLSQDPQELNTYNYKPRDNNSGGGGGLSLNSGPRAIRGSRAAVDSTLS
ncbi:GSCOCG00007191001-RA-CDS [Cotesia congregata]|uniref:Similar to Ctif: CBP80/20-dependent translation initiation factor (Mus musculus) n=1 Tax=Cotesia congregata TaxID=51543 RepID=A0A8J2MKQ4_COTCN|nr:GSCOCG00007191001-RA-CDS [Cotesia congregata]CAG5092773.1 Similar to Ctif: CBP80/20-dependent translation initiation factor (Mus musculus) [Cotesia congregata]